MCETDLSWAEILLAMLVFPRVVFTQFKCAWNFFIFIHGATKILWERTSDQETRDLFSSVGKIFIRKELSAHVEELSTLMLLSILILEA